MKVIIIGNTLATMFTATAVTDAIVNSKTTLPLVVVAEKYGGIDLDIPALLFANNDIDFYYFGNVIQTFILQWSMHLPSQLEITDTFNPSAPTRGTPIH